MTIFLARSVVPPFLRGNAATTRPAKNCHVRLPPHTRVAHFVAGLRPAYVARQSLAYRVFLRKTRETFSNRKNSQHFRASKVLPKPHSVYIRRLGILPLPSRHNFGIWERSHWFPGAILGFGSIPKPFPACFRPSGALPSPTRRGFGLREKHFYSVQAKIIIN